MGKILNISIKREAVIHVLCWGLIMVFPLFFYHPNDSLNDSLRHYLRSISGPLGYMVVFYINYFLFIPKYLFTGKLKRFLVLNAVTIFLVLAVTTWWWSFMGKIFPPDAAFPKLHKGPPAWLRYFQLFLMLILVVGLSVAFRMSQRWQHLNEQKQAAEQARTEAELENLRNQLNPHFLLNTLNNIYALIAFAPDKAQTAVGELSKLLRHALYDNQRKFVPLYKEVEFIKNYIELMKIRVTDNVKITTRINIDSDDATPIAPLIFISLIENAFKHGISQSGHGVISIAMNNDDGHITCEIRNTNYPKLDNDKSGSGIGLEQVSKRLEFIYKDHYTWRKGIDPATNEYYSIITLDNDNNLCDN